MDTLNDYVDALMNLSATENKFVEKLCENLEIERYHIKNLSLQNKEDSTKIVQVLSIELTGTVEIDGADLAKINGKFITPKTIELQVGEIHL